MQICSRRTRGCPSRLCTGLNFTFPILTDAHAALLQLFMHTVNAAGMCDVDSVWPVLVSLHSGANPPGLGFAFTVWRSSNCTQFEESVSDPSCFSKVRNVK